nr:PQQ-dependent sugar dehydrogenase [Pontibacillus sp. HN14]
MALVLLLVACNESEPVEEGEPVSNNKGERGEVIASNLDVPWDINKVGQSFYISERRGTIVNVQEDGTKKEMPLQLDKKVVQQGEGGLLGFVLHPDFKENGLAFLYHTYEAQGRFNRVLTVKLVDGTWQEENVLIDRIPGSNIHNGGRLEIGPDQLLYITTGDAANESSAQDRNSLAGKILRMNMDGSIPESNPFANSYVYSYGHRNPQGLAWAEDGTMYAAEHGSRAYDEINLIKPGANYGWPVIRGDEQKAGMEKPLFHSGKDTWAPSGLVYHNGKLYMAGLRGEQIRQFDVKKGTSQIYKKGVGRIRDLLIEDDSMYFVTNNTDGRGTPEPDDDKLYRIEMTSQEQ